jgi:hypothetical protein
MRFVRSFANGYDLWSAVLASSLGALRNAEHSHALAADNYFYHVTPAHELFFFSST